MTVMNSDDPACPETPRDAEDALRMSAFLILSRLQSGTEEVVRLEDALDAVSAERERCAKVCEAAWEIDGSQTAAEFAARVRGG